MLTVRFKVISEESGPTTHSRVITLLGKLNGRELLSRQGGGDSWHMFNVEITVFKGMRVIVKTHSSTIMWVRPRHGILEGRKIADQDAMDSALGEIAFHWLSQKMFSSKLVMPNISSFVGNQQYDSCMDCRWSRRVRMGSDELELDFSNEEGLCLRDMQKTDGAYQPEHVCILFGTWLEEQWGMLEDLNRIIEGGIIRSSIVNLNGGFGVEPKWVNLQDMVKKDLDAKACLFHRQSNFRGSRKGFDTTQVITIADRARMAKVLEMGPFERKEWSDTIPVGWMPRSDNGILVPGALEVVSETIDWEAAKNVQPCMQAEPKRLQNRNKVHGHAEEQDVPAKQSDPRQTAEYAELI